MISHDTDAILILEHSFYLSQQNDPQPVSSAIQKYNASNMHARVGEALEDTLKQLEYNKASENEKVDMILNVIIQNHLGRLNICYNILFINNFIPDTPAAR